MTEKLEPQPDEPLCVKVERHGAVYVAAVSSTGGVDLDREVKARLKIIRHAPLVSEERNQKLIFVAGYLVVSKGSLQPEETELLLLAPSTTGTLTGNGHLTLSFNSWSQPTRRILSWQIQRHDLEALRSASS